MLKLIYSQGGVDKEFELKSGSVILGRSSSCDIVIKDPSISGQHMRIDVKGGEVTFRDLLSSNGTKLNGQKVKDGTLRGGETLTAGKMEIYVKPDAGSEPATFAAGNQYATPASPLTAPDIAKISPDETPADASFVPAVVASASEIQPQMAVMVVKPGEGTPASQMIKGGTAAPKKNLIYAGAAAMVVIAVILLIIPKDSTSNIKRPEKLDYWGAVRDGEKLFRDGSYQDAYKVWATMDAKWIKQYGEDTENHAAGVLAKVAKAFDDAYSGNYAKVNWSELRGVVNALVDADVMPVEHQSFAQQYLMTRILKEKGVEKNYLEAKALEEAASYEEAIAKYAEVPKDSAYHQAVDGRVQFCRESMFNQIKQQALSLGDNSKWDEAVEKGEQALKIKKDRRLESDIPVWRENSRVEGLVRQFKGAVQSKNWSRATEFYSRLTPLIKARHGLALGLDDYKNRLDDGMFYAQVQGAYTAWDLEEMERLRKNERAQKGESRLLLNKGRRLTSLKDEAEEAVKTNIKKARDIWDSMRAEEPNADHPMNQYARNRMAEETLEKWGESLRKSAMEADFPAGKYFDARKKLTMAAEECGVAVAEDIETIRTTGRKLYNEGLSAHHRGWHLEAKKLLMQARDCFLPGEEWYKTIDARIRNLYGDVK